MNSTPLATIIICTRNRAADLEKTLKAMQQVRLPDQSTAELLVVDNGSNDDTAAIAQGCHLPQFQVRLISEPRPGQVHARNTGLAAARGDIIIFTDDDVRPSPGWLEGMTAPIVSGQADAAVGRITMAPHLRRPWMEPMLVAWMAVNEGATDGNPDVMQGANMAFSREVLRDVPEFDPELGPGALGFRDDTLFSLQIRRAGRRIVGAWEAKVEHHFHADRVSRASMLKRAEFEGRSEAYVRYHWEHEEFALPILRIAKRRLELQAHRALQANDCRDGMKTKEAVLMEVIYCLKQFLVERKRPRNYEQFGLRKKPE